MKFGTYHFHPTVVASETRPCIIVHENNDSTVDIIVFLNGKDDATQGVKFLALSDVVVGDQPYNVELIEFALFEEPSLERQSSNDPFKTPSPEELEELSKF